MSSFVAADEFLFLLIWRDGAVGCCDDAVDRCTGEVVNLLGVVHEREE
jgi:hypothetical protein